MISLETIEAKPRELVLKQYVDKYAKDCGENSYWHSPDQWYRWLVQLECGCVTEVLTHSRDKVPPTEQDYSANRVLGETPIYKQTWIAHPRGQGWCILGDKQSTHESRLQNPFPSGCCKPAGYIWCAAHDNKPPWREITDWIGRKRTIRLESGKSRQLWSIILSCGHCDTQSAEIEWSPGIPSHVSQENLGRVSAWLESPEAAEAESTEFIRGQIEHKGFMFYDPPIYTECYKCCNLRHIVEYRKIGKLSDRPLPLAIEPKPRPEKTPAEIKAQKLEDIQAKIARLQAQAERLQNES